MEAIFRFENLEIWKTGISVTKDLLLIADELESKKLFRFADQLRGAAMSITNNIAEGSGSFSDKDFANFLNISRRSVFECFNILVILNNSELLSNSELEKMRNTLDHLARKLTLFRKSLV